MTQAGNDQADAAGREVLRWTNWSGYDQLAGCPVCGRYFGVRVDGRLRYHGPNNRRCRGSLALPPIGGVEPVASGEGSVS